MIAFTLMVALVGQKMDGNTRSLYAAYVAEKPGYEKFEKFESFVSKGEPRSVLPICLKVLESPKADELVGQPLQEQSVALDFVKKSADTRAVSLMMGKFHDPKAPEAYKKAGYWYLAGTDGEAGAKVVLAQRKRFAPLPPLMERMDMAHLSIGRYPVTKLDAERTVDGKTWGLFSSGVFGSQGDLYLSYKQGGKWKRPILLGVTTSTTHKGAQLLTAELRVFGYSAADLAKGRWTSLIAHYQELAKGTGNGGLSFIERRRLGLSLTSEDSNGNGIADEIDPFPTISGLPKSDEQKVLAAVFEARFHFEKYPAPYLMDTGTIPAFVAPGCPNWVIVRSGELGNSDLKRFWDQGMGEISFGDFSNFQNAKGPPQTLKWNSDHTIAKTGICLGYGGLNATWYSATVKKFGSEWVVTSMELEAEA
jgi:hypothetical protein